MANPLWFNVLLCSLAALTAVANGVVVFVIIRRPQLHNTANWFILSLAVADIGVGLTAIPHSFLCEPGVILCQGKAVLFVYWFFLIASVTNLCCMVADRYISVVWSLRYNEHMTTKRVVLTITTAWGIAFVFTLMFLPAEYLSDEVARRNYWKGMSLLCGFLMTGLPSVFLLFLTGHMIYTARKLSRQRMVIVAQLNFNRPQESTAVITANREARINSTAIIVVVVVGCFVLCYSVDAYILVCDSFSSCNPPHFVYFLSQLLYLLNSALNPIAYSFLKSDIKTALRRLFCDIAIVIPHVSP